MDGTQRALSDAQQHTLDYIGWRIACVDCCPGFLEPLYYLGMGPPQRLAACVLQSLPGLLSSAVGQVDSAVEGACVAAALAGCVHAWRRAVLDGGPGRAFLLDDHDFLEEDLELLAGFFSTQRCAETHFGSLRFCPCAAAVCVWWLCVCGDALGGVCVAVSPQR